MPIKIRYVSLLLRKWNARKERQQTLRQFAEWQEIQRQLDTPHPRRHHLLIIRLDDIGDYLLFRNQLPLYKKSARWGEHRITLLGNSSWREIFTAFDAEAVDDVIWVNKGEYLTSSAYRLQVWILLRQRGFETVIAPSRTRPLLLDDLSMLAAAPIRCVGSSNTYGHASWNALSDRLYGELFTLVNASVHEFHFNGQFSAWACGLQYRGTRPRIDFDSPTPGADAPLICFVGANTRSRRWPAKRWIEFIRLYSRHYTGQVILAGSSLVEIKIAALIQAHTDASSIAGKVTLLQLITRVASAGAVVTNDTMAAHLGVSCARPTVIIANGVNYQRFTDYAQAGFDRVQTLYPKVFTVKRLRRADLSYGYTDALTSDIASIRAATVFDALQAMLNSRVAT